MTEPSNRTAIVTAADAGYFPLLQGMVTSVRDAAPDDAAPDTTTKDDADKATAFDLCVLDLGLDDDQLEWLSSRVDVIVKPGWDIEFPGRDAKADNFKAFTARPFLPKHFPGYDLYMWIDADAWVQDWEAVGHYLDAAEGGKLAIASEIDRCYQLLFKWQRPRWNTINFRQYRLAYGWKVANRLGRNPFVNTGAFALAADAPHWQLWQQALTRALQRTQNTLVEQTAMNYVVYGDKPPTGILPAWCNWMCVTAPPMVDEATGELVEPQPPHEPLGIVHLLGPIKDQVFDLQTLNGGTVQRTLRYQPAGDPAK